MRCLIVCALFVLFIQDYGSAALSGGDCISCHAIFSVESIITATVSSDQASNQSCINCHSSGTGETIKLLSSTILTPVVNNGMNPLEPLSGGNFYYVNELGDRRGHNVDGVSSPDTTHVGFPPGYVRKDDPSSIGLSAGRLYCAGAGGCHGDRNIQDPMEAITGSHHSDDTPLDGSTTAKSFRFLRITPDVVGVTGLEHSTWGRERTPGEHNEYDNSINSHCANCHSAFLTETPPETPTGMGTANPWKIHPAGIVLPDRGEFRLYNPDVPPEADPLDRVYSPDAPVGRTEMPPAPSAVVRPGMDTVICLSCHFGHAGPYRYNLRWDYDAILSGDKEEGACFICHTAKRRPES